MACNSYTPSWLFENLTFPTSHSSVLSSLEENWQKTNCKKPCSRNINWIKSTCFVADTNSINKYISTKYSKELNMIFLCHLVQDFEEFCRILLNCRIYHFDCQDLVEQYWIHSLKYVKYSNCHPRRKSECFYLESTWKTTSVRRIQN